MNREKVEDAEKRPRLSGAAAAPLLYWLLVVCGLAGITLMRMDSLLGSDAPADVVPLWIGSIGGVAIGQLIAFLRVRAWILGVVSLGTTWFLAPFLFFVFSGTARGDVATCAIAFAPAALCGYSSLSERGGLVAFWYPTVLWMLVILDGPSPGVLDARGALPFVLGLAALFVAFLFAKQTRRLAIWRSYGSVRLATPISRTVLRASPVRTLSQLAWIGIVVGVALTLSAWIAPALWEKEHAKNASLSSSGGIASNEVANAFGTTFASAAAGTPHCCAESADQVRVREYFPLGKGYLEHHIPGSRCTPCNSPPNGLSASNGGSFSSQGEPYFPSLYSASPNGRIANPYYGTPGAPAVSPPLPTSNSFGAPAGDPSTTITSAVTTELPHASPVTPAVSPASPLAAPAPAVATSSKPAGGPSTPDHGVAAESPPTATPPAPTRARAKPGAPLETGSPWRSLFAFCAAGILAHMLVRAARRQLTLRHLARPFWSETLDQRISNHWQRMLIGLRDAGIHPARDEQPVAFARRVGIEGMGTCATILERVRHGVRVESTDLDAMGAAATAVYCAARSRAGVAGRAAAWLRWPLV